MDQEFFNSLASTNATLHSHFEEFIFSELKKHPNYTRIDDNIIFRMLDNILDNTEVNNKSIPRKIKIITLEEPSADARSPKKWRK